ncbi:hypothetical protein [Streptomyces sp. NBC_01618]|uniref:hypothetical protein n=1 Tax=Streptomyces sp. NBC_01618 TaxID=2975900 RepID=UPI00386C9CD0|nr:hypothetical protein OH735_02550 [Streptomyces sp. NBC_01618]
MRVLFASTGGSGHFHPLVPLIDACTARGDDVLVVAPPGLEAALAAREQPYRIGAQPPDDELTRVMTRVLELPPDDGVSLMTREVFGRLCVDAMLPTLETAWPTRCGPPPRAESCSTPSIRAPERDRPGSRARGASDANGHARTVGLRAPMRCDGVRAGMGQRCQQYPCPSP